jgi:hypothetical protein
VALSLLHNIEHLHCCLYYIPTPDALLPLQVFTHSHASDM